MVKSLPTSWFYTTLNFSSRFYGASGFSGRMDPLQVVWTSISLDRSLNKL